MKSRDTFTVKEVAGLAGVSVRALHHYDAIGLLVPPRRTPAGYRLYDRDSLLRLQQILIGRELGLSLEEIRRSLDDPGFDRVGALEAQRAELEKRAGRTEAMIRAVDAALALCAEQEKPMGNRKKSKKKGKGKTSAEPTGLAPLFVGFDPGAYEPEAKERWGATEAWAISKQRTGRYTADDWKRFEAEQTALYADIAAAIAAGTAPAQDEGAALAERHRQSIDRWFYPCSAAMHRGLADLYEGDSRFGENMDRHGPGITRFLVAAIRHTTRHLDG